MPALPQQDEVPTGAWQQQRFLQKSEEVRVLQLLHERRQGGCAEALARLQHWQGLLAEATYSASYKPLSKPSLTTSANLSWPVLQLFDHLFLATTINL